MTTMSCYEGIHSEFLNDDELYWRAVCRRYRPQKSVVIEVPSSRPMSRGGRPVLVPAKGYLNSIQLDCSIASNQWDRLGASVPRGNVLDHIGQLLPKDGLLQLVTYQNGIQNTLPDFLSMGRAIIDKLIQFYNPMPLVIGLYNRSSGITVDLDRSVKHLANQPTETVLRTALFFEEFARRLSAQHPSFRWLHIAHSEGGAILTRALQALEPKESALMKKHLITLSYGPLIVTPGDLTLRSKSTYSKGDNTTLRYAEKYRKSGKDQYDDQNLRVDFVNSLDPPKSILPPGDHGFEGRTYQDSLAKNLKTLAGNIKGNNL